MTTRNIGGTLDWAMLYGRDQHRPTDAAALVTPSQLAVLAVNLLPLQAEEARKRMHQGRPPSDKEPRTARSQVTEGKAVEIVAKMVGVGETTVSKVARVVQALRGAA